MKRDLVLSILAAHREQLRSMGVGAIHLFGSVARGDDGPDSDVDLLADLEERVGLIEFQDIQEFLAGILGCRVDLVPARSLKPRLRERVWKDAIRAA
jgi:predicted nucleotidyltransferase